MAVHHCRCEPDGCRWTAVRAAIAALLSLAALAFTVPAVAASRHAALVIDANSGRVLHQSAADEPRFPASLAKMMTLYLAFELIEQGRLSYQTKITFSKNATAVAPSKLDLEEGESIALIDAIRALITKSANDVAVAIAEHIAGSEERFARLMTQKARELGMTATTFRNASGLPDEEQITTARDMATLALRLQDDFPKHYLLFATRTFSYKGETFRNHNTLLFHYEGTDGLKTGYTRASGFNLVASVRRGKKHVIGVVFGGASAASRNSEMRTQLNRALLVASTQKTRRPALVARARTAPERFVTTAAPAPQRVGRPPTLLRAPQPASAAAQAAPAATEAAAPEPPAAPSPAIETVRVRTVMIAPRAATPATAGTDRPMTIEDLLEGDKQPILSGPEPPTVQSPQWASASSTGALPLRAAPAPADKPALHSEPILLRGAAPSTLGEQAYNLAHGEQPIMGAPLPPLEPPATAAPPTPASPPLAASPPPRTSYAVAGRAGEFQIQIGAYQSSAEAERQLAAVRARAGSVLANRPGVTQQVQQGRKVYYRARYSGFEAQAAANACSELKRLRIDCLVMRVE